MNIIDKIKEKRPNLKSNSINAYIIVLKKLNNNKEIKDLDFLADKEEIKEKLQKLKLTTRRNYVTGILVVLQAFDANEKLIDYYKNIINDLNEEYTGIMSKNNKSEKQEANWIELSELTKVFNSIEKEVKAMDLKNRIKLKPTDFNKLQDYVIAGLYTLLPPIRLDFAPMFVESKKSKINDSDNYLFNGGRNKKVFIINEYKNNKSHGQQTLRIPSKLNSIINLWLKYNDTGNFLLNNRKEMLSANGLGKAITRIMKPTGKNITINLLRSIYISENVDMKALKKSEELAKDMMHSPAVQKGIYYKDD
tara:strand:- start:2322 stop:3242 length:921 start_codon:yes stop_codon:yes gene_type:complete